MTEKYKLSFRTPVSFSSSPLEEHISSFLKDRVNHIYSESYAREQHISYTHNLTSFREQLDRSELILRDLQEHGRDSDTYAEL